MADPVHRRLGSLSPIGEIRREQRALAEYEVEVGADRRGILLRVAGDVDDRAGHHLVELARLIVHDLQQRVCIDIAEARSVTPGAAKLLSRQILHRHGDTTRLRTRQGLDQEPRPRGPAGHPEPSGASRR